MYEEKLYEAIKAEILAQIALTDKREGSFVNDMVSPISMAIEDIYGEFKTILGIMFLEDSAGEWIDKRGAEYGIYRKSGEKAVGECTFYGSEGKSVPLGSLCRTTYGLLFQTTEAGVIAVDETSVILPIEAMDIGDAYNVLAGEIKELPVAISGITGVTNLEITLGGTGDETDTELSERILLVLQTPATSGNVYDYTLWALSVDGVGDAKIFPLDSGNGTVTVLVITPEGRCPSDEILQEVHEYIEEQRPIGATVTVMGPEEVFINVEAEIVLNTGAVLEDVQTEFSAKVEEYISESAFSSYTVDYYRILSMFYDISGVASVTSCLVNDGTSNIAIGEKEIQVLGTVEVTT